MKHLFVSLVLSLFFHVAMAQEINKPSSSQSQNAEAASSLPSSLTDSVRMLQFELQKLKYESSYVRHCLRKHHQEKTTGYFLSFFGGVLMGVSTGLRDTETLNGYRSTDISPEGQMMLVGGAFMSLAGTIMILDSEKWFKRAYIGPDGLGIKFNF